MSKGGSGRSTPTGTWGDSDEARWRGDYETFRHTQLARVQASARVWLGVLTTLLGLLGSVVLFKGGALVTGVTSSGPFQVILIVLVGLVFGVTVLAVILGGQATWGGLGGVAQPETSPQEPAVTGSDMAGWQAAWLGFARMLAYWTWSPTTRAKERAARAKERAGPSEEEAPPKEEEPPKPDWMIFKERTLKNAHRRRVYLHASRTAGVIAAGLIALLAVVAVIAGTISPPPVNVLVVHHGHLTCGPVSESLGLTGVTQVITVVNC